MRRPLVALVLLLAAGCLAPQDIREAEPADTGNHPPRIPIDKALVAGRAVRELVTQTECNSLTFELAEVEDPDVEDELEVRFFIDYDLGQTEVQNDRPLILAPEGREVRLAGVRFDVRLREPRTYVVEAWVSDGFAPLDEEPVNRAVLADREADAVLWLIEVEEGPCLN